jgi:hypothetical protein
MRPNIPHKVSSESLSALSVEWNTRASFESVLTSYSCEGKSIADVLKSGMGFVKLSDTSKKRERKWRRRVFKWEDAEKNLRTTVDAVTADLTMLKSE